MTESGLEAILDECLHNVSTQGESIERCLQHYPQYAGQLSPLVQMVDHIRKTSHPMLSASATKAIEQRLLKRATELRRSRATPSLWSLLFSFRPLVTVAATLIVVLALVLTGGGGIVYASTNSLPGSPLYGVKRTAEQVQLFLAPAGTKRTELYIKFAQRRLEEVQDLIEIKGQVDEETLAAIAAETKLALEETEKAPAQDKTALLNKLLSLTERQQAVLKRVQAKAPEAAQKGLNRALEVSQQGHEKARESLEKEKPGREVEPTPSPIPTKTPKPTHMPKATPTPKANHIPKPTHTPKPTKASKPNHVTGGQDQDQETPSTPSPGQDQETPSTPPGQAHESPVTPPGQSGEEHGPPAEPPGQEKDKDEGGGPPAEPPGQEKDKKDKDKDDGKDKDGGKDKGGGGKDKGGGKGKGK